MSYIRKKIIDQFKFHVLLSFYRDYLLEKQILTLDNDAR